ncbi:MAG: hypothetical protein RRC34_01885 [Lentisphaeria bacterium]|nr:hypothetical protein [Lentisphaeria bacterium]
MYIPRLLTMLFFSPNRRYLTGMDWMVRALDHASKRETGVGNVSQVVLELKGRLDEGAFRERARRFVAVNPVVGGVTRRAWHVAPYWSIPEVAAPENSRVRVVDLPVEGGVTAVFDELARIVNEPFAHARHHLAFSLITQGSKSFVALRFDHRLLDARGAEMVLMALHRFTGDGVPVSGTPAHLSHWLRKFTAGKHVNRTFLSLRGEEPSAALSPLRRAAQEIRPAEYRFSHYSPQASQRVADAADDRAGFLMMTPYLLGCATHVFNTVFEKKNRSGDYVVSVNVDGRAAAGAEDQVFFNHVSFLFFKFLRQEAGDLPRLWTSASRQWLENARRKRSADFAEMSMLTRILPVSILNRVMRILCHGAEASFAFSYIAESGYQDTAFMGLEVDNVHHMPRVPPAPGVGLFFTSFHGRLNVVLSSLAGLLTATERADIMKRLDAVLRDVGDDRGS